MGQSRSKASGTAVVVPSKKLIAVSVPIAGPNDGEMCTEGACSISGQACATNQDCETEPNELSSLILHKREGNKRSIEDFKDALKTTGKDSCDTGNTKFHVLVVDPADASYAAGVYRCG